MARACPSCQRPNSDAASRCLYCTAPLPEVEGDERSEVATSSPHRVATDRHLVILIPFDAAEEGQVVALSQLAKLSLYDARVALLSRRPRLFRRVDSEAEARRLSDGLTRSRIWHYVVSETALLSLPVASARSLAFHDGNLDFLLSGAPGAKVSIPHGEVLLLVRGEITRERHLEGRLGTSRAVSRRLTPGARLHLYQRDASVAVEIDPEGFDFSVLSSGQTPSALLNLEGLASRISSGVEELTLDRGFDQEPPLLARAGRASDGTDAALAGGNRRREGVLYDNEEDFRFYSRWRYRLARHLSRK